MMEAETIAMSGVRRLEGTLAQGMGRFSARLGATGHMLTRTLTIPILGIGGAAAKMSADFQRSMEMIHTQAGASQREVDKLSKQVLALAKTVPYGPQPLADSLYHLESIGLRLNKQFEQQGIQVRKQIPLMKVLKVAAEGAAVGHANLEATTTALGSAWLSGIKGATDLGHTMGVLNAIVGTGNMRMQDLVTALGTGILPMAKLAGLSLRDVGAALAVMSDEGYPASSAATQMATALHYLYDPTIKATKALKEIGVTHTQLAEDMHKPQGLLVALTDLKDHLESLPGGVHGVKAESVIGDIFPAGRGRVLSVLMNQLTNYQSKLGQIQENQGHFADAVRRTMEQPAVRVQQAWAKIQSDLVNFGSVVLPRLIPPIETVAKDVDKVVTAFSKLSPATQNAVVTGGLIVAAIGPGMRIASFFLSGVSKLLAAATIAGRIAGGKGLSAAFGRATGEAGGARAMMEVAEMRVAQMIVGEMVGGGGGFPGLGGPRGGGGAPVIPGGGGGRPAPGGRPLSAAEYRALEFGGPAAGSGWQEQNLRWTGTGWYNMETKRFASVTGGRYPGGQYGGGARSMPGVYLAQQAQGLTAEERFAMAYGGMPGARFGAPLKGEATLAREMAPGRISDAWTKMGGVRGLGSGVLRAAGAASMVAFLAPVGIALATGLSKLLQHFDQAPERHFAEGITKGIPGAGKYAGPLAAQKLALDRLTSDIARTHVPKQQQLAPGFSIFGKDITLDPQTKIKLQRDYFNVGWTAGKATVEGLSKAKALSSGTIVDDFMMQLKKLPADARPEGARVMLQWAQGMVDKGKLPRQQFNWILRQLEAEFPNVRNALKRLGLQSSSDFASAMKFNVASDKVKGALEDMRTQLGYWDIDAKITGNNVWHNVSTAMDHLRGDMQSKVPAIRKEAEAEFKRLQRNVTGMMTAMGKSVASHADDMRQSVASGSQKAYRQGAKNWGNLQDSIGSAIAAGVITVQQGMDIIVTSLNQTLSALGEAPLSKAQIKKLSPSQRQALASGQITSGAVASPHAQGGLYTIGQRGERGADHVPVSIMAGKGERVAIFNAAQQAVMDAELARYGGLDGLFAQVRQPHHATPRFQGGGMLRAIAEANKIDSHHYNYEWGGGHNAAFAPTHGSGHGSGPGVGYDCSGAVSAVLHSMGLLGQPMTSGPLMGYGQPGEGPITIWANPVHTYMRIGGKFFGTSNSNPGGGAGWFPGSARGGFAVRHVDANAGSIVIPTVLGTGAPADAARGAVRQTGKAANKYLTSKINAMGHIGGGQWGEFGSGGSNSQNMQLGHQMMRSIWGEDQWPFLQELWQKESGWSSTARNPSSGAAGIPQDITGNMHGGARGQIGWGLSYIRGRYGTPERAWAHEVADNWYSQGGFVGAATGLSPNLMHHLRNRSTPVTDRHGGSSHTGSSLHYKAAPHRVGSVPSQHQLDALLGAGKTVNVLEADIVKYSAQYDSLANRFGVEEQQAQYLNDDGSLNALGIQKKLSDDQHLLWLATLIYNDYVAEKKPVTSQLRKWLGIKSKTASHIEHNKKILAKNALREQALMTANTALSKPTKDRVGAIQSAIKKIRLAQDPKIHAAESALKRFTPKPLPPVYTGKNRQKRAQNIAARSRITTENADRRRALQQAVNAARTVEYGQLQPLQAALVAAQDDRRKHSDKVKQERFDIRMELRKLRSQDKRLQQADKTLQAILSGDDTQQGAGKTIAALETVGDKLGTIVWNGQGRFKTIDTSKQGAAFDEMTTILGLQNTIGQDKLLTPTTTDTVDNSALIGYYQSLAMQSGLANAVYLAQSQAMAQMTPFGGFRPMGPYLVPYAGSFANGGVVPGPIGAPSWAMVHGGERITPPDINNSVKVLMEDNRTRVFVDDVERAMEVINRRMVRTVARRLPGNGGGSVR